VSDAGSNGWAGAFVAADEAAHRVAPGAGGPWWSELWWFGGTDGHGTGVFTAFGVVPSMRRSWYVTGLVRPGRPLAFVADDEIVWREGQLSLRRPGLWADHVCEAPFEQWTVANEAHAVELDDPEEAIGDARGTQTALAVDLEWYASAPAVPLRPDRAAIASAGAAATLDGYLQLGEIDGVVELPGGSITCTGPATRIHGWGDLSLLATAGAGGRDVATADEVTVPVRWPMIGAALVVEHRLTQAGWTLAPRRGAS
jgi:hypothetical protein